jgi:DNA-binding HxlR family transcriptional regulator
MDIPLSHDERLLAFFKALADANRLKIVGLLAQKPYSVEQLAAMLHLRPSTVSHHLARLSESGLVSGRAESYYNVYELETETLRSIAQSLLSSEALPAVAANVDMDAYNRKVLADFLLPDGRLKSIPAQRKKLEAVLRHIAGAFQSGQRYTEKQINDLLSRFHEDTATLRRELIGYRILARAGGEYWKIPPEAPENFELRGE